MSDLKKSSKTHLSLWDTVSIIVGIVIGAGIYETAPLVLKNVASPLFGLSAWALGGLLSLVGALCYAELASTYPRSGGDYVYLTRAYGRWAGFLFGWAQLAIIMTGSIGMMAYVFGNYASSLWNAGPNSVHIYAILAVLILSLANLGGIALGKRAQNILTIAKVLGLAGILVAGFFSPGSEIAIAPAQVLGPGSFGLAMVLVLYTYGGWNDAAYVASEVDDKRRNIPRALIMGTLCITVIYLLVNAAYLAALGFNGARASQTIAADVLRGPLGEAGAKAISLLVMVSALGAVNGLIFTGSRVYSALGEDFRSFSPLARWRRGSPVWSLLVQTAVTLSLMTLVGTNTGRSCVNTLLNAFGVSEVTWAGHGGFDTLLRCTAPVFWFFFLMTGFSLFLLRYKDRATPRVFSVPLYPVLPLIFCGTCSYMLYSSAMYAGKLMLIGCAPLLIGLLVYAISSRPVSASQAVKKPTQPGKQKEVT